MQECKTTDLKGLYRAVSTGEIYEVYYMGKQLMMRYVSGTKNGQGTTGFPIAENFNRWDSFQRL